MLRRTDKAWNEDDAWALFARSAVCTVGGALEDGWPIVRTVHPVVHEGGIWFHGAPEGEKISLLGRPVQIVTSEIVAEIPSTAFHPVRACPATTFYVSAAARGVLVPLDDPEGRAAVMAALMRRMQPEGGYAPIDPADPLYTNAIRGLTVLGVHRPDLVGKAALGHRYTPAVRARVLESLWTRGAAGDVEAIDRIADAAPPDPWPAPLAGPGGIRLRLVPRPEDDPQILDLLRPQVWNQDMSDARILMAQRRSPAWVGAFEGDRLLGTARAIGDGGKLAYVMDVAVRRELQRSGIGRAMLRTLLDHPAVRGTRRVELHTRDAVGFYHGLGFDRWVDPPGRVTMRYVRP